MPKYSGIPVNKNENPLHLAKSIFNVEILKMHFYDDGQGIGRDLWLR